MTEKVGHEVIDGVRELLPVLRDRAQEAEDGRVVPADSIKALEETGFFRLLQPSAFGGLEADPLTFYTAVRLIASACGSTGWVVVRARRASLAPGLVHAAGAAGGLGHRPGHADLVLLRADRQGGQGRRRPPGQRPVELLLRLRSRDLGAARPDRHRRGQQADRLPHVPAAARRLRHRGRLGHRRPARHRQQRHRGRRCIRARAPVAELRRRLQAGRARARS